MLKSHKCQGPKISGPAVDSCCPVNPAQTIEAPVYELQVSNPALHFGDCNVWQDDDEQLVREGNNDYICIDNA